MIAFYMPTIWIVLVFRYSSMILWGVALAANANLMLEQVPKYRGSMMSLRVAFAGIGSAVGVTIGGIVLSLYNYQAIALTLGALGIVGSFILLTAAKDPCKPPSP
jgi:predicted MFS family arabinose efflux permease